MSSAPHASVAILAGGRSTRLGQDKAGVLLNGEPMLVHIARGVASLTDDLMVVLRAGQIAPWAEPTEMIDWRLVRDTVPGGGIVGGLASALAAARHDLVWIVGCDMPFLSPDLLRHERAVIGPYEAVVPRVPLGIEPLHALYRRSCLGAAHDALAAGVRRVSTLFAGLRTGYLDPADLAPFGDPARLFFNINTPEDVVQAQRMLAQAC